MTDGQWLFTVFAALYLLECARWLPGSAFGLAGIGKTWNLRRPWAQVKVAGSHLLVLPVLPPMQAYVVTQPWLLVPCEGGVEICDPDAINVTLIPWAKLAPQLDGAQLTVADGQQVRLLDEASAKAWKERVLGWAKMNQAAREKDFLKLARRALDTKSLTTQATQLSRNTRGLRWLAMLIFFWTFSVITVLYRWLGESPLVLEAAAVLLLLLWTQAFFFFRAAGRVAQPIKHRFWKSLAIAFLPQHAMRATDLICRSQTCAAHPLAARELLDDRDWRRLAIRLWKNLQHGQSQSAALQVKAFEVFFKQQDVPLDQLEEVPERHPGSVAYCPNCFAQFIDPSVLCQDCGGLTLKTWPEPPAK